LPGGENNLLKPLKKAAAPGKKDSWATVPGSNSPEQVSTVVNAYALMLASV
jgi:hypothetical protein